MTESELTKRLKKRIKERLPRAIVLKHADRFTAGIPDMSITLNGDTSWWEIKHITKPGPAESRGIQNLTAMNLALEGICWYIVFESSVAGHFWYVVEPRFVTVSVLKATWSGAKHDYDAIVDVIAKVHNRELTVPTARAGNG